MEEITVKDLVIDLDEYACVNEDATLFDAVMTLEKAWEDFNRSPFRHRYVLVLNHGGDVIGRISQWDVLRSLEPGYDKLGERVGLSRFGFRPEVLMKPIRELGLWENPLDDICRKAANIKVREIMYAPSPDQYIDENASLQQAIHSLVVGRHRTLLVKRGEKVVGVLRLSDIFMDVWRRMKACRVEN